MNGTWPGPDPAASPPHPAVNYNPGGLDFSHLPLIALGIAGLLFWVLKK